MDNRPDKLDIPLGKKGLFWPYVLPLYLLAGWLSNQSHDPVQAVVAAVSGGAILYLFVVSPFILPVFRPRAPAVSWAAWITSLCLTWYLLRNLVPWLMQLAASQG